MKAITVEQLSKSYGKVQALREISFEVDQGSIFGFLGPNGAGKSTAIGIMLQFLYADSGRVEILGEDVRNNTELKKRIAIIPDADLPKINGLKLLQHTARYHGFQGRELKKQVAGVVKLTGIRDYVGRSTTRLSKGQKTRIKIANALVSDPELVIADEPTSGLDPFARRDFLELISKLATEEKRTVFFSSHVIGEVEKVCDEVVILNRGRVLASGPLAEISQQFPTSNSFSLRGSGLSKSGIETLEKVITVEQLGIDHYLVQTTMENGSPDFLKALINDPSITINAFSRESMDLERIFMETVRGSEL